MSESDPMSAERQPQLSGIRRYYKNLVLSENDRTRVIMAVIQLMDNLPFATAYTIDDFEKAEALPSEWKIDAEPRIAHEQLALLPLLYFGPELEHSQCDLEEVEEWYSEAIVGIKNVIKNDHDNNCYVYDGSETLRVCEKSTYCPNRIMEAYLGDDVRKPCFDSDEYTKNPERKHDIAIMKARIGQHYDILEIVYDDRIVQYDKECREYFPDVSFGNYPGVQDNV